MAPACTYTTRYRMAQAATLLRTNPNLLEKVFEAGYTNASKFAFHVPQRCWYVTPQIPRKRWSRKDMHFDTLDTLRYASIRFDTLGANRFFSLYEP